MLTDIPIFVISFNRGRYLSSVIPTYRRQNGCGPIIIHDNGSMDEETLDVLEQMRRDGCEVVRRSRISSPNDLLNINTTISEHFSKHRRVTPFVITDCDIDMACADQTAIETYGELLSGVPDAGCVGPMLRISDVPTTYPLFNPLMRKQIHAYWRCSPEWMLTTNGPVGVLSRNLDTTFALHRGGMPFRRNQRGLRVYHPFEARHLDWYRSGDEGDAYPKTAAKGLAHWADVSLPEHLREVPDRELLYLVVVGRPPHLRLQTRRTGDNPSA